MLPAVEVAPGVSVSKGRYRSQDPRWDTDFQDALYESGAKVLADFRGHNSRERNAA